MPARKRTICVIGAGAAGISLADAMAQRGWRVDIVEGGALEPPAELEDTFQVHSIGTPHRGAHIGRFRAWGGSTTRWGGQLWPWEPHEFESRPYLGLEGWPIPFADVARFYDAVYARLGLREPTLSPERAAARGVRLPPLDPNFFALKYSTWLPWRLRNLGRSIGTSLRGHPMVRVRLRNVAQRIVMGPGGVRVAGVRVRQVDGTDCVIAADVVVLAAGAIENARLLLASREELEGPGRSAGWLGRAFMDHLSVRVARFRPRDASAFGEMFGAVFVRDVQYTPRMVLRPELLARERLLAAYGHWDVEMPSDSALLVLREKLRDLQAGRGVRLSSTELRRIAGGAADLVALARGLAIDRRRYFPRKGIVHLRVDSEQRPNPESRITTTSEQDAFGLPRVAIDWRVTELERRTIVRAAELLGAELERQGVGHLEAIQDPFAADREWGALRGDSFHMMGGTRMAPSPATGVVDTDARVFDTDNLYVAGTSIFPTGGMANPTLTMLALTLRLAEHIDATR